MARNKWLVLLVTVSILLVAGGGWMFYKAQYGNGGATAPPKEAQELEKVEYLDRAEDEYDVIVVGTDPEGIAAAVSSARNGLKTLLVDGNDREILGGLMTLGWLNTIDLNYDVDNKALLPGARHGVLNEGIFSEWYEMVEGDSFDVTTAANAFNKLVKEEENIDLVLMTQAIEPVMAEGAEDPAIIEGVRITNADGTQQTVTAKAVIDATQDGDIGYAAGVPFTLGREDLGDTVSQMAVTLVFSLTNADEEFWQAITKRLADLNDPNYGTTKMSAWGFNEMQEYPPQNPERLRMRGLNIGRQNDETILINALQIFGVDPYDPQSKAEAIEIAKAELPHVLAYMQELYPEFANLKLGETAPELYVRESRHMKGMYRLTILDLLENKDHWDRIGFGSYPVDIQRTSPSDYGAVVMKPIKYAIPFRSIVPQSVDNLLVVGKASSYDTLPHGSARVIPTGMATAESAGAAVKIAMDEEMTFREMAESKETIKKLQDLINSKGMNVQPYTPKIQPYMEHPAYPGLKVAVYLGMATGGYDNNFHLDDATNAQRFVNQVNLAKRVYPSAIKSDPAAAIADMQEPNSQPLTLQQASLTIAHAVGLEVAAEEAQAELESKGLLNKETVAGIENPEELTNGDSYMIFKDVLERLVGVKF